jgi:hypothetical protein
MASTARFAYLQVRLRARHGTRIDESAWRRLQGSADFANCLRLAQQTALRPWVMSLHPGQDSSEIEQALRRQFRVRLAEVTGWIALEWRPAVRWVGRLLDLPALRHLLAGEPAPAWLRDDPELRAFASEHAAIRLDSMLQSDCRPLAQAWQAGMPLLEAWIRHWRSLWPNDAGERRGMDELCRMLRQEMLARQRRTAAHHQEEFEALQAGLVGAFRRYSFLPAAAFLHLALTSLDLNRLRGDLLVRRLFQLAPEPLA